MKKVLRGEAPHPKTKLQAKFGRRSRLTFLLLVDRNPPAFHPRRPLRASRRLSLGRRRASVKSRATVRPRANTAKKLERRANRVFARHAVRTSTSPARLERTGFPRRKERVTRTRWETGLHLGSRSLHLREEGCFERDPRRP